MPSFYTFTGPLISPLRPLFDEKGNPLDPEVERAWLRDNPRQVARIRRVEVLLSETPIKIIEPMFLFSLRVLDPREADGWRLATVALPGVSAYCDDKGETLDDAWPNMKGDPAKESDFVLSALMEAVYVGESWAEPMLRSLVLPDTSGLDPDEWGLDFTPYDHRP